MHHLEELSRVCGTWDAFFFSFSCECVLMCCQAPPAGRGYSLFFFFLSSLSFFSLCNSLSGGNSTCYRRNCVKNKALCVALHAALCATVSLSLSLSGVSDAPKRALVQAKSSSIWCETLRFKKDEKSASQKKKKSRERKGQNKIHGKSAQVSFPPLFSNGNTATIDRRKKKKTL